MNKLFIFFILLFTLIVTGCDNTIQEYHQVERYCHSIHVSIVCDYEKCINTSTYVMSDNIKKLGEDRYYQCLLMNNIIKGR